MFNCNYKTLNVKQKLSKENFFTADFETTLIKEGLQDFILGGLTDGNKFYYFTEIESFINFCIHSDNTLIYFHNLSYDFRFMMDYFFNSNLYSCEIIYHKSKIIKILIYSRLKCKGKKKFLIEFRDSFSLLPISLKKCSKAFNKIYFKQDFDFTVNPIVNDELINYLMYDCLALFESLQNFKSLLNSSFSSIFDKEVTDLKLTIASNSLNIWKKIYNIQKIQQYWYNYDFFQKSMYGGRCEVFNQYGKNLKYYDFNSLYPSVMKDEYYPIGRCFNMDFEDNSFVFYIAYVKNIDIPDDLNIPPVPYKHEGLTIYPVGRIKEGVYNSVDLQLFSDYGVDYDFVSGYGWLKSDNIFSDYVNRMYELKSYAKKNINAGLYEIAKFSMNTLFGKLGQDGDRTNLQQIFSDKEFIDKTTNIKDLKKVESTEIENFYKFIYSTKTPITNHISSFILSYARRKLYLKIKEVESLGGVIYYCDTDSIVTDINITSNDYNLGDLALEYDNINQGFFALPKMYFLDIEGDKNKSIIRSKGVNLKSFKSEDIINFIFDKKSISNTGVRVSKISKIIDNHLKFTECYSHTKNLGYDSFKKRNRLKDSFNTTPIKLNEW